MTIRIHTTCAGFAFRRGIVGWYGDIHGTRVHVRHRLRGVDRWTVEQPAGGDPPRRYAAAPTMAAAVQQAANALKDHATP
jgi:hypothetical protein